MCKDELFDISKIDKYMLTTIHNYNEIINVSYNPNEIIKVLKQINVIEHEDDLCKLTCNDIVELRTIWHGKFVEKYCKLSTTHRALKYLESKKKLIENLKKLRIFILSIMISLIATIISFFFAKTIMGNIVVAVISFILSEMITTLISKYNLKLYFIDDILDKILGLFIPDVLYLYKIYEKIKQS